MLQKKQKMALISIGIIILASFSIIGYSYIQNRNSKKIILATTTSTNDSGLLDYLLPEFEKQNHIRVEVLSVGTGQALEIGRSGDADVLLVHSRAREDEFIANGYGVHRACVMYNDFVIVGPSSDPARIFNQNLTEALNRLILAGENGTITFFSRGDGSGTHSKELALWGSIGFIPNASTMSWYKELGSGMGTTLIVSNENQGYTLVDRGTWLSTKASLNIVVLFEGDSILLNPYGAILVNPDLHSGINYEFARSFVAFLVSEQGQTLIDNFKINGEQLFHADFGRCDELTDCNTTDTEIEFWATYNGNYTGLT
ncbi:substrate-binding domain-containing protein [Candidatus Harpocratesius sp.]